MGVCVMGDCYWISVGGSGDATVVDSDGQPVWSLHSKSPGSDAESVCDALFEALSWTAQRHTGRIVVQLPERDIADELIRSSSGDRESRLSSILDDARALLTWFESTDVALRDDARVG